MHAASLTNPRLAEWFKRHLSWFSPALMVDWLVAVLLVLVSERIERSDVFERDVRHYLHDNSVKWPHHKYERVPGPLLDKLTWWLPLKVDHENHYRVGQKQRHSGTAFQAMFFLCLFLAGKNRAFALHATFPRSTVLQSRMLRLSLALAPLFLAVWIAITRLEDNWHHPTDVLAGATIGILSSALVYQVYYVNPFRSDDWQAMDCPKLVYGAREPEEGRIALALAGEDEEGLLSGRGDEEA
ncbi:hypothetical protein OIO90_002987 [Microbotryomycetes sp. JL221]|nr:hypothetical protein OIO90_002987 [Microbotryomycetes sp. JL221]